jgi:hypothetical protein
MMSPPVAVAWFPLPELSLAVVPEDSSSFRRRAKRGIGDVAAAADVHRPLGAAGARGGGGRADGGRSCRCAEKVALVVWHTEESAKVTVPGPLTLRP